MHKVALEELAERVVFSPVLCLKRLVRGYTTSARVLRGQAYTLVVTER